MTTLKAENFGFASQPPLLSGGETAAEVEAKLDEINHPRANGAALDEPSESAPKIAWPTLKEVVRYGLAGEIVRAIEPHSESDPAALLIQTLVAAGNIAGPGLHCKVESTRHALNLFALLVGATSKGRKGTGWDRVKSVFRDVDEDWAKDRIVSGLSSAEGLINEVQDSPEGKNYDPDRRLLVVQTEFAAVLRVITRDGNTLSPTMRDAFDHGNLRTLVKHNPLRATGAHISVIGHITANELLRYLTDTEYHNGFANRFLFCCVRRSRVLPEGGHLRQHTIDRLARSLWKVVDWAGKQGINVIQRDRDARALWAHLYPKLSQGVPGLLGAATSRAAALVMRLSAIYAVLDESLIVRVEHLNAATAVWDYCFASARYLFGDATGDPVADRLREALQNAGDEGMTRTAIRDLFGRHQAAGRIDQALAQLAALGIAHEETVRTEGRSIELWIATEAIKATKG